MSLKESQQISQSVSRGKNNKLSDKQNDKINTILKNDSIDSSVEIL